MANGERTFEFGCGGRPTLRYLLVAAAVGLPKGLFLGRLVVRAIKPSAPAAKRASSFLRTAAPRPAARRRRSSGKKK